MDDSAALKPVPLPLRLSALRRWNSIATPVELPLKLSLPNNTTKPLYCSNGFPYQNGIAPVLDFDLLSSLKSSIAYTSLKDLLPSSSAAVGSLIMASAANSSYKVSIRNRLVKQAAWAYLQPMSSSTGSSGSHFLSRLCLRLSSSTSFSLSVSHGMTPLDILKQRPRSTSSDIVIKQLISDGGISNCEEQNSWNLFQSP